MVPIGESSSFLQNHRVAILVTHGFETRELIEPKHALEQAGAQVEVVSPEAAGTELEAFHQRDKIGVIPVDRCIRDARAGDYHALFIPGGLFSPDALRTHRESLEFVADFFSEGKPVGAICHGAQVLISAGVVEGRTLTGVKAIQVDLRNAGAHVRDVAVVEDEGLVTSRNPDDLPQFCQRLVQVLAAGEKQTPQAMAA